MLVAVSCDRISYVEFLKPFALRKQTWRHGNNMLSLLQHPQPALPLADIGDPPQKGLNGITSKLRQKVSAQNPRTLTKGQYLAPQDSDKQDSVQSQRTQTKSQCCATGQWQKDSVQSHRTLTKGQCLDKRARQKVNVQSQHIVKKGQCQSHKTVTKGQYLEPQYSDKSYVISIFKFRLLLALSSMQCLSLNVGYCWLCHLCNFYHSISVY